MSALSDGWVVAFGFSPGPTEMLVILGIALLLYGGRLPEVARSWGKTLAELRRSMSGIQNDLNDAIYTPQNQLDYYPEETMPHSADVELTANEETTDSPEEKPSTADTD